MLQLSQSQEHPKAIQDNLEAAVTYFHNHRQQMNYAFYGEKHYPIIGDKLRKRGNSQVWYLQWSKMVGNSI